MGLNVLHIANDEQLKAHYQRMPDRIASLTEFVGVLEYRWAMRIHYFRGEPEVYQSPCLPSIWRAEWPDEPTDDPNALWTAREQSSIAAFQEVALAGNLDDPYFDYENPPPLKSTVWLELAQHYGHPTRLLDVTLDPLVALYFAVRSAPEVDGAVFLSNGSSFNTLDPGEFDDDLKKFFAIYKIREYSPQNETLFFYRPLANNRRMIAQRGQFVWCRAVNHSLRATDTMVKVAAEGKQDIRNALERLGYDEASLLPPGLRDAA